MEAIELTSKIPESTCDNNDFSGPNALCLCDLKAILHLVKSLTLGGEA